MKIGGLIFLVLATSSIAFSDSVDVFPLAVGNTFLFKSDITNVSSNFGWIEGTRDSGIVRSIVDSVVIFATTIRWSIREEWAGIRREWSSAGNDSSYAFSDTLVHDLIESSQGYHELQSESRVWDFPVAFPGASYSVFRYADSSTISLSFQSGYCMCCVGSNTDSLWFQADSGLVKRISRRCIDNDDIYSYSIHSFVLVERVLTSVAESMEVPSGPILYQNYPNPFNPSTTLRFSLPRSGNATLRIYNLLGEQVATLISGYEDAGPHTVTWEATSLPSGVYFYRLSAGEFVETKKLVLVR